MKILLLEDDDVDAESFKRTLDKLGLEYYLKICKTCEDARHAIVEFDFDFAVLDQNVPDGTGLELIPLLYPVPSIILTGNSDKMIAVEAFKNGAVDFLEKSDNGRHLDVLPSILGRVQANAGIV